MTVDPDNNPVNSKVLYKWARGSHYHKNDHCPAVPSWHGKPTAFPQSPYVNPDDVIDAPVLLRYRDLVPVLFLSVEPMLGPITFRWRPWMPLASASHPVANHLDGLRGLDWLIVGGESGPRHRPFELEWARILRDECQEADVAFHFKQVGGRTHADGGCLLDGREWKEFPA